MCILYRNESPEYRSPYSPVRFTSHAAYDLWAAEMLLAPYYGLVEGVQGVALRA